MINTDCVKVENHDCWQVRDQVGYQVCVTQVRNQVGYQVRVQVRNQVRYKVRDRVWLEVFK